MSDTPLWLQTLIPTGTLVGGFLLGRVSKRLDRRQERKDAESAKAPEFEIVRIKGENWYALVNSGHAKASSVTLHLGDFPSGFTRQVPVGVSLEPRQPSERFFVGAAGGHPKPTFFAVSCDQLDQPVPVPMPV